MKIDAILASDIMLMRQFELLNQANSERVSDNRRPTSAVQKGGRRGLVNGAANGDSELEPVDWNNEMLLQKFRELRPEENKFFMLQFLDYSKKVPLLARMSPKMLFWAISLFPPELLRGFLIRMNKKKLIGLFLKRIRLEKFLSLFPKEALLTMLMSKEINKNQIMRGLMGVPVDELRRMGRRLTGRDTRQMEKPDVLAMLNGINKEFLVKGMMQLSPKSVLGIVTRLAGIFPEIMQRIPDFYFVKLMETMPKELMLRLLKGAEPEQHMGMLATLENNDLSYVLTALDPDVFQEIMLNKFPDAIRAMAQPAA
jgi:hypothetical protein